MRAHRVRVQGMRVQRMRVQRMRVQRVRVQRMRTRGACLLPRYLHEASNKPGRDLQSTRIVSRGAPRHAKEREAERSGEKRREAERSGEN